MAIRNPGRRARRNLQNVRLALTYVEQKAWMIRDYWTPFLGIEFDPAKAEAPMKHGRPHRQRNFYDDMVYLQWVEELVRKKSPLLNPRWPYPD